MDHRHAPGHPRPYGDPSPTPRLKLYCFPHAGAGAIVYRSWSSVLPPPVEVCAIDFPGRGSRFRERPLQDLQAVVDFVLTQMRPSLGAPFALFGHSMGALLAFELARRLSAEGSPPRHLFVSGHQAPHLESVDPPLHALPEAELVDELRRLNGTPPEVLGDPELLALLLPILRADLAACERYVHRPSPPLAVPISAFGGVADRELRDGRLEAWRSHTRERFAARFFPGDHFFLNAPSARRLLVQAIEQDLSAHLAPR